MLRKIVHRVHRTEQIRMMMKQEKEKRVIKNEERKKNQKYKYDNRLIYNEKDKIIY